MNWVSRGLNADARSVMPPPRITEPVTERSAVRRLATVAAPLLAAAALTVVTLTGLSSARGRIAASTSSQSLMGAGSIDLVVGSGSSQALEQLAFDETGLYAGQILERCLTVTVHGSFDEAAIRLHAQETGGNGLSSFIDASVQRGSGTDPECTDFMASSPMYTGPLDQLLGSHSTFASGLPVAEPAVVDQQTTVRIRLEVVDDNDAQDRTTTFDLLFEARP